MVAQISDMARVLARAWVVPTQWEAETGACMAQLRGEDSAWVRQMYEEEHGGTRKWAQHHAHQAAHIVIWDGQGVGAAVGAVRQTRVATCDTDGAATVTGRTWSTRAEEGQTEDAREPDVVRGSTDGGGSSTSAGRVEEPPGGCDRSDADDGDERGHAAVAYRGGGGGKRSRGGDKGGDDDGRGRNILRRHERYVGDGGEHTEAAEAANVDNGSTGGECSAGNAEVEGITEAEYMRGVKRKRERDDDTPPSPSLPIPLDPTRKKERNQLTIVSLCARSARFCSLCAHCAKRDTVW